MSGQDGGEEGGGDDVVDTGGGISKLLWLRNIFLKNTVSCNYFV